MQLIKAHLNDGCPSRIVQPRTVTQIESCLSSDRFRKITGLQSSQLGCLLSEVSWRGNDSGGKGRARHEGREREAHHRRGYSDRPGKKTNIANKFLILEGGGGIHQEPRDQIRFQLLFLFWFIKGQHEHLAGFCGQHRCPVGGLKATEGP